MEADSVNPNECMAENLYPSYNSFDFEIETYNTVQKLVSTDPPDEELYAAIQISRNRTAELESQVAMRSQSGFNDSQKHFAWPLDPRLAPPVVNDNDVEMLMAPDARSPDEHSNNNGAYSGFGQGLAVFGDGVRTEKSTSIPSVSHGVSARKERQVDPQAAPRMSDLTEEHLKLLSLVPDHIIAAEHMKAYDPNWPAKYGVSDAQIEKVFAIFRAKAKFEDLFRPDQLGIGDIFRVRTQEMGGTSTDRLLVVHSLSPHGRRYPRLQFLTQINGTPTGLVTCKGPSDIFEAVKQHFNPHHVIGNRGWKEVYLIKAGIEMGSLGAFRERRTSWKMMVALWARKNDVELSRRRLRMNKKTGTYAIFPAVEFRGSGISLG